MKKILTFFIICLLFFSSNLSAFAYDDEGTIQVTGTVAPPSSAMTIRLTNLSSGPFGQGETLRHRVEITSTSASPTDVTLEIQWGKGTIEGNSEPTVDIVEYVLNSASNGTGNVTPLINLTDRTIRWHFSDFANETTSMTFEVRTRDTYTGEKLVQFPITARMIQPAGVSDKEVTHQYRYRSATVTPTPTPTPQLTESTITIQSITIPEILTNTASIDVETSSPATLQLRYGDSIDNLSSTLFSSEQKKLTRFKLNNLTEDTPYYFQVVLLKSDNTVQLFSDLYFFQTAKTGEEVFGPETLSPSFIHVRSFGGIIYSSMSNEMMTHQIIGTQNDLLEFIINLPEVIDMKRLELSLVDTQVLGLRTYAVEDAHSSTATMQHISDTLYQGKLRLPAHTGKMDLVLTATSLSGQYVQQKIAEVFITNPITVVDDNNQQPIEDAQVFLYLFNPDNQLYELLSPQTIELNPVMTDTKGIVTVSLFPGKYKAEVFSKGFQTKEVEFVVDVDTVDAILPTIQLSRSTPFIMSILSEYDGSLRLFSREYLLTLNKFSYSLRFMNLLQFLSTLTLFILIGSYVSLPLYDRLLNHPQRKLIQLLLWWSNTFICLYLVFSVVFLISGLLLSSTFHLVPFTLLTIGCLIGYLLHRRRTTSLNSEKKKS